MTAQFPLRLLDVALPINPFDCASISMNRCVALLITSCIEMPVTSSREHLSNRYGEDISWLVDLSAVYPDAFFVRIIRVFEPSKSAEEMATSLYKDEHDILNLLELNVV